jgi:hypothetical protein
MSGPTSSGQGPNCEIDVMGQNLTHAVQHYLECETVVTNHRRRRIKRVPVERREWISPPLRRLTKSPPSQSREDCQLRRGKASLIARGHKK